MLKLTRRKLIKQASIGAGAVGMLATAKIHPGASSTMSVEAAEHAVHEADTSLVICAADPGTGTLTVMRGEREIIVKNAAFVHYLSSL